MVSRLQRVMKTGPPVDIHIRSGAFCLGGEPMNTQEFKRKLTAVFSADVAGYSRLMGEDEAATVKTLESYKEVMFSLIRQHRGRVIDSPGDNLLAEFASVVDAVQCAVAVQKELQARNADLPENRRMQFRIGINLGDVIEEQDRIYGDGVNIAARLESCADPGGICVSKTAFDHIESKLPLGYEFLGEQQVKNIAKPVGAYRVLMDPRVTVAGAKGKKPPVPVWRRKAIMAGAAAVLVVIIAAVVWNFVFRPPPIEPASKEKMAFPLPDKPSIAVMPFSNMSGDKTQDSLCDGLSESIITALAKTPQLFVIGRDTTFSYKGKTPKAKEVSEELGVQYVLEGSVQRSGDRVRVTAQLIDALKGYHLWADRYDRELKDLFSVLDEITMKIITALHIQLAQGESARIAARGTANIEAYLKAQEAAYFAGQSGKEGLERAKRLSEEAIALDPNFPYAYMIQGSVHMVRALSGLSDNPKASLELANKMQLKAIELDESFAPAMALRAWILAMLRKYDDAASEAERAYKLAPGNSHVLYFYGIVLSALGRPEEALPILKESLRLEPKPSNARLRSLGMALRDTGQYGESIAVLNKAIQRVPDDIIALIGLTVAYGLAGRDEEAHRTALEVLRVNPKFSVEKYMRTRPEKDPAVRERMAKALIQAGLPEKPPLPLPDKPSIAVLPFDNMSGDPKQDFFSDGITEEIISALSRISGLFVIARNSTFTYKGKSVWVPDVARDLGVQYVLEGSVRRSGDRVRITAQLIDGKTNNHIWSETYDRELKDIFAVQDDITMKILTKVKVKLAGREDSIAPFAKRATNLQAYLKILEAGARMDESRFSEARRLYEEALSLDPKSPAYAGLALNYIMDVLFGPPATRAQALGKALEYGEKCIEQDETDESCHRNLCYAYTTKRDYEKALHHGRRAVELNPNSAVSASFLSFALRSVGEYEEAVRQCERAIRLDPKSYMSYYQMGATYSMMRRHHQAIEALSKALELNPKHMPSWLILVVAYSSLDRMEEARAAAAEVFKLSPNFSVDSFVKAIPYKDEEARQFMADALRKGGLK